ncbi:MAG: trypsin-like peptidase domain-containing protein [Bacteriovoracaceae bacterium]
MLVFIFAILSMDLFSQEIIRLKSESEVLEIRKKAFVSIEILKNGKVISNGGGFFINKKGTLVTNFHVVYPSFKGHSLNNGKFRKIDMNDLLLKSFKTDLVYRFKDHTGKPLYFSLLGCGNDNNLDICYLKSNTSSRFYFPLKDIGLKKIKTKNISKFANYLSFRDLKIQSGKTKIVSKYEDFLQIKNQHKENFNRKSFLLLVDKKIKIGDSGGPVFNSVNGDLYGITTIRYHDRFHNKDLNVIISVNEIIENEPSRNLDIPFPQIKKRKFKPDNRDPFKQFK